MWKRIVQNYYVRFSIKLLLFIYFFLYYHLIKIEYIGQFNILRAKTSILQISFLVSFLCIAWICDQYKLKLEAERKFFPSSKHHQIIIPTPTIVHVILPLILTHTHTHTSIFHTLSHTYTPINYLRPNCIITPWGLAQLQTDPLGF